MKRTLTPVGGPVDTVSGTHTCYTVTPPVEYPGGISEHVVISYSEMVDELMAFPSTASGEIIDWADLAYAPGRDLDGLLARADWEIVS